MNFHNKEVRIARAASSYVKIAIALICAISLCGAIVLTVFNRMHLGSDGLYKSDAPTALPVWTCIAAIAVSLFGTMHIRKATKLDDIPRTGSIALPMLSFLICAEFLAIFIIYFLLGPIDILYAVDSVASVDLAQKMKTALLCYRLLIPLSLFAPVYFVISAFKKRINALFGTITLAWILLYILRLYFDVTDWVMSPRKLTMICSMCIAALFILYELRFAFGRGNSRRYFFYASLSAIFGLSCGVAGVLSVLSGVYSVNYELPYYGVALLLGVYALVRVFSFIPGAEENTDDLETVEDTGDSGCSDSSSDDEMCDGRSCETCDSETEKV